MYQSKHFLSHIWKIEMFFWLSNVAPLISENEACIYINSFHISANFVRIIGVPESDILPEVNSNSILQILQDAWETRNMLLIDYADAKYGDTLRKQISVA